MTHKTLQGVYTVSIACAVLYTKRATHQLGAWPSLPTRRVERAAASPARGRGLAAGTAGRACKTLRARRYLSSCQEDYAWRNGVCAKIAYGFAAGVLVALAPAALIGWQLLDGVRDHFGRAFADNFTQLNRQRILAPVSRELAYRCAGRQRGHAALAAQ